MRGCQLERKVVPHDSKNKSPLYVLNLKNLEDPLITVIQVMSNSLMVECF